MAALPDIATTSGGRPRDGHRDEIGCAGTAAGVAAMKEPGSRTCPALRLDGRRGVAPGSLAPPRITCELGAEFPRASWRTEPIPHHATIGS